MPSRAATFRLLPLDPAACDAVAADPAVPPPGVEPGAARAPTRSASGARPARLGFLRDGAAMDGEARRHAHGRKAP